MPPSHIERPSPAEQTAPAACLPAPAAAGQGMGTQWSLEAEELMGFVSRWDSCQGLRSPDVEASEHWRICCVRAFNRILSCDHGIAPGCDAGTGNETGSVVPGTSCTTGNEARTGRPPVHVTPAKRKAAYRAAKARIDYTDSPEIVAKLHETAAELDCSLNELLRSMVRFAQTNRNWKQLGLFGARRNGELQ